MRRQQRVLVAGVMAGAVALTALAVDSPASTADAAPAPPAGAVRVIAADPVDIEDAASALVAGMSVRERAASVVMGHVPTTDPTALSQYMSTTGVGGFILMGANIPQSESDLRALTQAMTVDAALPPLLAIDEEGGDVSRLPLDGFASAVTLKDLPVEETRDAFAGRGAVVQRAGIGVNFGIVADVTADPGSFIFRRALGTTPEAGADRVAAAVFGEGDAVLSTLKHFPGHGGVGGDSHTGIPSTALSEEAWLSTEAMPFQSGIDAGAPLLMFGHLAYTAVDAAPASLSAEWHRIAREELGFDGVSVTDDLGMLEASGDPAYADPVANAVTAIAAGNDMVLNVAYSTAATAPRITDGIVAAVESGTLPGSRLQEAATRVTELRLELAADGRGMVPCPDCTPAG